MGLFDIFKGKKEDMTPIKMCVISMMYLYTIDGDIAPEEIGQLLSVVGGKSTSTGVQVGGQSKGFIEECLNYVKSNKVKDFQQIIKDKLTDAQKLYLIVNMLDASLSDGKASDSEEQLIEEFISVFNIDPSTLGTIVQVLELKNDRNIFIEPDYVKNQPDFKFKITM